MVYSIFGSDTYIFRLSPEPFTAQCLNRGQHAALNVLYHETREDQHHFFQNGGDCGRSKQIHVIRCIYTPSFALVFSPQPYQRTSDKDFILLRTKDPYRSSICFRLVKYSPSHRIPSSSFGVHLNTQTLRHRQQPHPWPIVASFLTAWSTGLLRLDAWYSWPTTA